MTVLAAAIGDDGTWVAADGQSSASGRILTTSEIKWKLSGTSVRPDWGYAASGEVSFNTIVLGSSLDSASDLWRKLWPLGDLSKEESAVAVMGRMRMRLRATEEFEIVRNDENIFGDYRISPLLATDGRVWRMNSDLRTLDPAIEGVYQVAGSGEEFAAGAISALLAHGCNSAEVLVRLAVEAASRSCTTCGGEVFVHRIGGNS